MDVRTLLCEGSDGRRRCPVSLRGGDGASRTGFSTARFIGSLLHTAREVILRPVRFYRDLDPDEPLKRPVIFAVACYMISFLLTELFAPLDPLAPDAPGLLSEFFSQAEDNLSAALTIAAIVVLVLFPLGALLGLYLVAAFQHLFVMIFVRPRRDFEATLTVTAYATAVSLLAWVPVLGYAASFYALLVSALGMRELHGTTTARALLATLVPALLTLAFLVWPTFA